MSEADLSFLLAFMPVSSGMLGAESPLTVALEYGNVPTDGREGQNCSLTLFSACKFDSSALRRP